MATTIVELDNKQRKREILTFLLSKPEEQSKLFEKIINKDLIRMKQILDSNKDSDPNLQICTDFINEDIYQCKLREIKRQTDMLKDQMVAHVNGIKHPSLLSIIERKLFIIELQLDIGVYNLLKNNNVKFYFDV
jgi:hypothetical protein